MQYRRFFSSPEVIHKLEKIGFDGLGGISLSSILDSVVDRSVFLKIDIEGAEYRILDDIAKYKDLITGIAIEFHDIDLHRDRITHFLKSLPGFAVNYVHPNNYGGVDPMGRANAHLLLISTGFTSQISTKVAYLSH